MTPPPDPAPPVASEVPLFGEPPRDERRPDGPSPDPARQGRRRRPDADDPEPGPAPALEAEPPVLGGTEHDLLAQLQAELADRERRPRPYRRARSTAPAVNGHGVNGHGVNGHGADGDRARRGDPARLTRTSSPARGGASAASTCRVDARVGTKWPANVTDGVAR